MRRDQDEQESASGVSTISSNRLAFKGVPVSSDIAADAFYRLAKGYYDEDRPFGTFSKSEIDLIMFDAFDQAFQEFRASESGNSIVTDFDLALKLRITPSRVQTLRTKVALRGEVERDAGVLLVEALTQDRFYVSFGKTNQECRLKLMFQDKIRQMSFVDALRKEGIYHDLSFSGIVVEMTLSGVLALLMLHVFGELDEKEKERLSAVKPSARLAGVKSKSEGCDLNENQMKALEQLETLYSDAFFASKEDAAFEDLKSRLSSICRLVPIRDLGGVLDASLEIIRAAGEAVGRSVENAIVHIAAWMSNYSNQDKAE